jgi:tetratricopeptide (TPR) repeat protein
LDQQQYDQAQNHAQRALELGKEHATAAHFVLARIYAQRNNSDSALKQLDAYLATQPSGSDALEAHKLLDNLQKPDLPAPHVANANLELDKPVVSNSKPMHSNALAFELMPPPRWMPHDVDDTMPPVESTAGCPLQTIQNEAGKRVSDFVDAVNRIAATESMDNDVIDRSGLPVRHTSRSFSYVASVEQLRPGMYTMEEYRNGGIDLDVFPERIATLGLTALVMVFHPAYREDYEVTCEGLSRWHGGLAWQVHFRQRANRPPRLRSYRINGRSYPIALRGRAWISAENFQVENIETDLVSPVPQIRLRAEHIALEYVPVQFASHHQELWLPHSADIYFDLANHRLHRRHHFENYMLFAVDEKEQIAVPEITANSGPASLSNH